MQRLSFLRAEPPCLLAWLSNCLRGDNMEPFPYLPGICLRTRLLVLVCWKIDYNIFCRLDSSPVLGLSAQLLRVKSSLSVETLRQPICVPCEWFLFLCIMKWYGWRSVDVWWVVLLSFAWRLRDSVVFKISRVEILQSHVNDLGKCFCFCVIPDS